MKKNALITTLLLAFILSFANKSTWAQDFSNLKIAIVNMQYALNNSVIGQQSKAKIEERIKSKTAEFKAREESLIALRQEINNGLLNDSAKQKKISELEEKQNQYLNERQNTDVELQKLEQEFTTRVFNEIKTVIEDYAKTNKYDFILENSLYSALLYSKFEAVDITEDIIKEYDRKNIAK